MSYSFPGISGRQCPSEYRKSLLPHLKDLLWLSVSSLLLLHLFVQSTTTAQSPHVTVQTGFCSTVVTISSQLTLPMSALVNVAALRRKARDFNQEKRQILAFESSTRRGLSETLPRSSSCLENIAIATDLLMCSGRHHSRWPIVQLL